MKKISPKKNIIYSSIQLAQFGWRFFFKMVMLLLFVKVQQLIDLAMTALEVTWISLPPATADTRSTFFLYLYQNLMLCCTLLFEFKCLGHGGYLNFTWFLYNVHLYNNCAIRHLLAKSSLGFGIKSNWIFLIEFY